MNTPINQYWQIRLDSVKEMLESNNFEVFLADNAATAKKIVLEEIVPRAGAKSIAWGGSMTFTATGLYDALKKVKGMKVLDPYDKTLSREESIECRRQSLLVDLFITGTNAITEMGILVNLDMIGNRVAALTFGPKSVIVLAGRNKIVPDLEEAMVRVKNIAAPANTMRLGMKTPCAKTSYCEECRSKDRICNSWAITEKSFPKGRIKIVLINEDLGL
ncbi:MAG: lactate utilization protein [Deltaproteobacteria bacterium]|nr:lactate utilization protein [Deltaproteobacteria bacterium]